MKTFFRVSLVVLAMVIFWSCGPSQRERAAAAFNEAKSYAVNGDTLKALDMLASIGEKFPKAKIQIGASKNLADELYRQLIDNRKAQSEAVNAEIAGLEKGFVKEKTEFDRYTQYVPERLSFNRSWNKSFIQVNLDERGEIFLTSHYMGKDWLKHTAIRVYDEELQSKTDEVPIEDPNNRESDFLEYKWEKVSYTNGRSDSLIQFIAKNSDRNLKCVFIGKSYYYIILEDYNKQSIKDAWELSCAIKHKKALDTEIKELETKRNGV